MALPRCSSVFITGCNRGLGLEFVKQLLRLPNPPKHVIATCRSLKTESAFELKELASTAHNLHLLELDVNDFQAIQEIGQKVSEILGKEGLNVLINNAGINIRDSLDQVSAEGMMKVFQNNCVAPLMITKALLPSLKRGAQDNESSPKAAIVNISSRLGSVEDNSKGGVYPYRASKSSLNMVTKCLSVDLKEAGICAVVLHPGWVQTDMGGTRAPVIPAESIEGTLNVIGSLDLDKTGKFYAYNGDTIPW